VRIAYLNPCGKWGGAETSLRELLASVRQAEPSWELWLLLAEDGPLARIAEELGVRVAVVPFPPALAKLGDAASSGGPWPLLRAGIATLNYAHGLARWLRQVKPDIIHTNGFKMHLLGARARPRKTPLVWHIHDYVGSRRLAGRLLRWLGGSCNVAVVNSNSVASDVQRLLPALRTVTIYNAIDVERFSPSGATIDLDAAAGLAPAGEGTIRVGLVATFARWKGHQVFLDALTRLPSDVPVRGYIIGGPIYQTDGSQWSLEELRQKVEGLQLTGKVGFTGFLDDPAAAMRSLDVIIHASTAPEPFGMVIIEGMACGKPVIASQAGGAAELFVDGENALGYPPGDADMLAGQITRLARDPDLRHRIGEAARATAERTYQGQRLAQELTAVYRNLSGAGIELARAGTPHSSLPKGASRRAG